MAIQHSSFKPFRSPASILTVLLVSHDEKKDLASSIKARNQAEFGLADNTVPVEVNDLL